MRGTPWQGLFYGFVIEVLVGIGAVTVALQTADFLQRAIAWGIVVVLLVVAVRTLRRVAAQSEDHSRPMGRWWYGG